MTFQIQIDYNKRKRCQNEKEDKNAKRQNKRPTNSTIDKQEFKNIKHGLNDITNYICFQDVEKKM
jgi:ribosomal protein S4